MRRCPNRSSVSAFFLAMSINLTETRKTPASRRKSCEKPFRNNERMNNPHVNRITMLAHGSEDLCLSMSPPRFGNFYLASFCQWMPVFFGDGGYGSRRLQAIPNHFFGGKVFIV